MHNFAGFLPCTPQERMIETIILCSAFALFAVAVFFAVKYLGRRGLIGQFLAFIAIMAIGVVLFFAANVAIIYFIGFCTS